MDCFVASLLAMTEEDAMTIYADARQKEGPPKRAFKNAVQADRDQAVLE
jgi:hypothetical protein